MAAPKINTSAECLELLRQDAHSNRLKPEISAAAHALYTDALDAKKIFITPTCHTLIEHTADHFGTQEILGQLGQIKLPFDKVWLEAAVPDRSRHATEPTLPEAKAAIRPLWDLRFSALLKRDNDTISVRLTLAKFYSKLFQQRLKEEATAQDKTSPLRGTPTPMKSARITYPVVSLQLHPKEGIIFDEDSVFKSVEHVQKYNDQFKNSAQTDATNMIDCFYYLGDYIGRMLTVLNATAKSPDALQKNGFDEAENRQNRKRARLGRPPQFTLNPIDIDVTRAQKLHQSGESGLRELLGWTSVRRSKPILKKDGTTFTRKPHDRKIAAPVDRRDVARVMRASQPESTLSLDSYRPELILPGKDNKKLQQG